MFDCQANFFTFLCVCVFVENVKLKFEKNNLKVIWISLRLNLKGFFGDLCFWSKNRRSTCKLSEALSSKRGMKRSNTYLTTFKNHWQGHPKATWLCMNLSPTRHKAYSKKLFGNSSETCQTKNTSKPSLCWPQQLFPIFSQNNELYSLKLTKL